MLAVAGESMPLVLVMCPLVLEIVPEIVACASGRRNRPRVRCRCRAAQAKDSAGCDRDRTAVRARECRRAGRDCERSVVGCARYRIQTRRAVRTAQRAAVKPRIRSKDCLELCSSSGECQGRKRRSRFSCPIR